MLLYVGRKVHVRMTGVLRLRLTVPVLVLGLVAAGLTGYLFYTEGLDRPGYLGSAHEHLFFRVEVFDQAVDFSQRRFQLRSQYVHFENENGQIMHLHADNIDLDYALETLGFGLSTNCLTFGRTVHCTNSTHALQVWVDGQRLGPDAGGYDLSQGDNVIVRYGRRNTTPNEGFMEKILPPDFRPTIPGTLV